MDKELSPNIKRIVEILENGRPSEKIEIVMDRDGKPDTFIVTRSQKILLNTIKTIKPRYED